MAFGDDHRSSKRAKPIYYFEVYDQKTDLLIGHVVDITENGVMLVSKEPIELEEEFSMRVLLNMSVGGSEQLSFTAKSIWSDTDVNPDYLDTGFEFVEISEEDIDRIKVLIKSQAFRG